MSRLLLEWVNDEVVLSRRVMQFTDLSNGFLYGELLYRFNQQLDFGEFVDSDKVRDKIENFCMLERTIANLGIKGFDSLVALKIIKQDSRAAGELLLKIQTALGNIKVQVGRHPATDFMPGKLVALTNFVRIERPGYDSQRSRIFRRSISIRLEGQNVVDMEKHLQPFRNEQIRQEKHVMMLNERDKETQQMYYQEIRNRRNMDKRAELEYLNAWHEKGIGLWMENQRRRKYATEVYSRFEEKEMATRVALQENQLLESKVHTLVEINKMEKRLEEMNEKLTLVEDGDIAKRRRLKTIAKSDQQALIDQDERKDATYDDETAAIREEIDFLKSAVDRNQASTGALATLSKESALQNILVNRQDIPKPNAARVKNFIADIRLRKGTQAATQARREMRRTKFVSKWKTEIEKQLESRRVELLRDCVNIPCEEEKKLQQQLDWQINYIKVVQENRAARNAEYEAQREQEQDLVKLRELTREVEEEERFQRDKLWFSRHVRRIEESVEAARKRSIFELCNEVVEGIVDISLQQVDHCVEMGEKSLAFPDSLNEPIAAFVEGSSDWDNIELQNYLQHQRHWAKCSGVDSINDARLIGDFLIPIRVTAFPKTASSLSARSEKNSFRRFRIQAAVVGTPLAGRSTMAWRLAARYNLHVVDPTRALEGLFVAHPSRKESTIDDQTHIEAIRIYVEDLHSRRDQQRLKWENNENMFNLDTLPLLSDSDLEEKLFQLWDVDCSGDIDPQEVLRAAFVAHCEGKSKEDLEIEAFEAFTQMDFDLNGKITREEFAQFFEAVFGNNKREAIVELLLRTDELCKPIDGWVLDGFPNTREQAKLLELALSGVDADEVEYQLQANHSFPCAPPPPVDPTKFHGLEAGALDVVFSLQLEDEEVLARASRKQLHGVDRTRVAPTLLQVKNGSCGVKDWYARFLVHKEVQTGSLTANQIFSTLDREVQDVVARKRQRDEEFQHLEERRNFLRKCTDITQNWLRMLGDSSYASGDRELDSSQRDNLQADICTKPIPPVTSQYLIASGVCSEGLLGQEQMQTTSEACWFEEFLATDPETAKVHAEKYLASLEGKISGISFHMATYFQREGFTTTRENLLEVLQQSVPLPDGVTVPGSVEKEDGNATEFSPADLEQLLKEYINRLEPINSEVKSNNSEETTSDEIPHPTPRIAIFENVRAALREFSLGLISAKRVELEEQDKKAKKGKKGKGEDDTKKPEVANPGEEPPESERSSEIPQPLAKYIVETIDEYDQSFIDEIRQTFKKLRVFRDDWKQHLLHQKAKFDSHLRSEGPDGEKQNVVSNFQKTFDEIPEDIRFHPRTKQEFHLRLEEGAKQIWELIHAQKDESVHMIEEMREDSWLKTNLDAAMDLFLHMVQLEVAKYQATRGSLVLGGIKLTLGSDTYVSPEQKNLYTALWVVAGTYGLSPDAEFPFEGGIEQKKGKGKTLPKEESEQQDEIGSKMDQRLETARSLAARLCDKLQAADPAEFSNHQQLRTTIDALDRHFQNLISRLVETATERYFFLAQCAKATWTRMEECAEERFNAEVVALEGLVLYISKAIEDAKPLAPLYLALSGCSFMLLDNPPTVDEKCEESSEEN